MLGVGSPASVGVGGELYIGALVTVLGQLHLNATTVTVTSSGSVVGTGRSHATNNQGPTNANAQSHGYESGTHGGVGMYDYNPVTWGTPYGSTFEPVTVGSGSQYCKGGAALRVTSDVVVLDGGTIAMDGGTYTNYGGGAGGSVWLTTRVLRGSGGSISAAGDTSGRPTNQGCAWSNGKVPTARHCVPVGCARRSSTRVANDARRR